MYELNDDAVSHGTNKLRKFKVVDIVLAYWQAISR
jgi:hypothetical protein